MINLRYVNMIFHFPFSIFISYVFSAPGKLMDSQPGTLMLTDCLNTCLKNATCQSVNYETGLCVLFSAHADQLPGMVMMIMMITMMMMMVPYGSRTV